MTFDLVVSLKDYVTQISLKFDEYVIKEGKKPRTYTIRKIIVTNFDFRIDGSRISETSEFIKRESWSEVISEFNRLHLSELDIYKELVNEIATNYSENLKQIFHDKNIEGFVRGILGTFSYKILHFKTNKKFTTKIINKCIEILKSELELKPSFYRNITQLAGLFTDLDEIKINEEVMIRKVKKEDFETEVYYDAPVRDTTPFNNLLSILTFEKAFKDDLQKSVYLGCILNVMRLFKIGSIYAIKSITDKETMLALWGSSHSSTIKSYTSHWKYAITEENMKNFSKFVDDFSSIIFNQYNESSFRYLRLALERYEWALIEMQDIDRRLLHAVMGFEALFSKEKESSVTKHRYGLRIAKMLSFLDKHKPNRIKDDFINAYGLRNDVVHGNLCDTKWLEEANEIFPRILDYLRLSIIIFLLNLNKTGNEIIDLIEGSFLNNDLNMELKGRVLKVLKYSILND